MGVDRERVKQRLEEEQQRAAARAQGGVKYWTPKNGENRIRIMPPWKTRAHAKPCRCEICHNADDFCREVYLHWNVGADEENQQTFACPVRTPPNNKGSHCVICSFVDQLRGSGDAADAELAGDIRAKQQFYSNIVDLTDPVYTQKDVDEWLTAQQDKTRTCPFQVGDTKVQAYRYGSTVWKELMDLFMVADISDIEAGRNIVITRDTPNPKKPKETKYRTRPDFENTVFPFRGTLSERIYNLDLLSPFASEADMQKAIAPPEQAPGRAVNPPPASRPPAPVSSAPAAAPAALPPASTPAPAAAAPAPQPAAQKEPPPPCFKDPKIHNMADPECVGGQKGSDIYEKCPYLDECHVAVEQILHPQPARRAARKPAQAETPAAAPAGGAAPAVDALEQDMRNALKH